REDDQCEARGEDETAEDLADAVRQLFGADLTRDEEDETQGDVAARGEGEEERLELVTRGLAECGILCRARHFCRGQDAAVVLHDSAPLDSNSSISRSFVPYELAGSCRRSSHSSSSARAWGTAMTFCPMHRTCAS